MVDILIDKLSKYDCLGGSILGVIPQCGIPVAMANLYSGGLISILYQLYRKGR